MSEKRRIEDFILKNWTADKNMIWSDGQWWTAGRFFELVEKDYKSLSQSGFTAGCRLVTLMVNCPAFLALEVACWKLKGTVVPLNASSNASALASSIERAQPIALAVSTLLKKHEDELRAVGLPLAFVENDQAIPVFGGKQIPASDSDVALLFFTSGTTGVPNAVPLTHENILSDILEALPMAISDIPSQVMLNVLPNFHTLGCIDNGILPMVSGFPQATRPAFLPVGDTMKAIDEAGVTLLVGVPTLLHFLVSAALKAHWKPKALHIAVSGGDRLSVALFDRAKEVLGTTIVEGYGLTECSPVLAVNSMLTPKRGCMGRLLDSVQYQLHGLDGNLLSGNEGVLWVKGPTVVAEYYNEPEITACKFKDGWFNTGDMVRVDEDGYVTMLERVSDLIIVGGFNVYPQEVEQVLNLHPAVKESAVVGMQQSVTGQSVKACVILKDGAQTTVPELVEWCRSRLPHYKVPRRIEFVSDLPRNAMGKVLRRKLR